jgi:hypothetical protein
MTARARFAAALLISFVAYTSFLMAVPYPAAAPWTRMLLSPTNPLLETLGLRHRLRLFAPTPPRRSRLLKFRLVYADGSARWWDFPRDRLAPGDPAHSYNRYLLIYSVWAFRDPAKALMRDLARYIAVECSDDQDMRRPVAIEVVERWCPIPPPEQGIGKAIPAPDRDNLLLRYFPLPDKLETLGRLTAW